MNRCFFSFMMLVVVALSSQPAEAGFWGGKPKAAKAAKAADATPATTPAATTTDDCADDVGSFFSARLAAAKQRVQAAEAEAKAASATVRDQERQLALQKVEAEAAAKRLTVEETAANSEATKVAEELEAKAARIRAQISALKSGGGAPPQ